MTSRKKRPIRREQGKVRDARLFLIVSEGSDPERAYFELFDRSPRRLRMTKNKLDWQPGDVCAVLLDMDRWGDGALSQLAREANDQGAVFALSNPCFEFWIMLHFCEAEKIPTGRKELKRAVGRKKDGMGAENFDKDLAENVKSAIRRAIKLDLDPAARWPVAPGSRVYMVMNEIQKRNVPI